MKRRQVDDWVVFEDDPLKLFGRSAFKVSNADLLRWQAAVEAERMLAKGGG